MTEKRNISIYLSKDVKAALELAPESAGSFAQRLIVRHAHSIKSVAPLVAENPDLWMALHKAWLNDGAHPFGLRELDSLKQILLSMATGAPVEVIELIRGLDYSMASAIASCVEIAPILIEGKD